MGRGPKEGGDDKMWISAEWEGGAIIKFDDGSELFMEEGKYDPDLPHEEES